MPKAEASVITADYVAHTRRYEAEFRMDHYFFRLQVEGNCSIVLAGTTFKLEQGHLLLLAPGDRYRLVIEAPSSDVFKPVSDFYLYGEGSWIDSWWKKRARDRVVKLPMDQHLLQTWKQINLAKRRGPESAEMLDYLLRIFCLHIDRCLYIDTSPLQRRDASFLVARMKDYIDEHATDNFTLQDVADRAGLSISRTVALFKSIYGRTVMQYAMDVRMSIAVDRMQYSKMSLELVAETCGFGTYSYFFRCFKTRFGMSPSDYRDRLICIH